MLSPRTAAASPQPRRDDNKTTTDLSTRALSASRAKRRMYKSMPPPLAGCRPGEPEKSTHIHRRQKGRREFPGDSEWGGQSVAEARERARESRPLALRRAQKTGTARARVGERGSPATVDVAPHAPPAPHLRRR